MLIVKSKGEYQGRVVNKPSRIIPMTIKNARAKVLLILREKGSATKAGSKYILTVALKSVRIPPKITIR